MSNDGIQRDINDCKYVKSHRSQEDPTNFLKIALYFDDVEKSESIKIITELQTVHVLFPIAQYSHSIQI